MIDVFISYKRDERSRVEPIQAALVAEGLNVWIDAKLTLGDQAGFDRQIEEALDECAAVLVCWSNAAYGSVWVRNEAETGLDRNVLVPVRLENCRLPLRFRNIDTLDISDWGGSRSDVRFRRIVERIKALKVRRDEREVAPPEKADEPFTPGSVIRVFGKVSHEDLPDFCDAVSGVISAMHATLDSAYDRMIELQVELESVEGATEAAADEREMWRSEMISTRDRFTLLSEMCQEFSKRYIEVFEDADWPMRASGDEWTDDDFP